jgi:GTP-binding protein
VQNLSTLNKPLDLKRVFLQQIKTMGSIVAIVGRPNVGKSTFFNRMIQKREAIVDSISGVTRDRHYGKSDWNGRNFTLIDTGGYVEDSDDIFQKEIDKQVNLAIEEADAIIFMVDVADGVTGMDPNHCRTFTTFSQTDLLSHKQSR